MRAVLGPVSAIGRRELLLWVTVILFANVFFRVDGRISGGTYEAALALFGRNSVFQYLGWYAVLSLLLEAAPEPRARWIEVAFALALSLGNVRPLGPMEWMSATAVGGYLLAAHANDTKIRAAAVVLLALAFNGLWGPLLFGIFSYPLLVADTALVGGTIWLFQEGVVWHGNIVGMSGGEHRLLIYGPCSSFHNISLGLLCWVALTKLSGVTWARGDYAIAGLVAGTVVLLNTARLYVMTFSYDAYHFWHLGAGQEIFSWITTFCVLAIGLWGSLRRSRTA
jgi:hypothetical protein